MFRNCVKYDVAKDCLLVSQRPLDIRITSKFSLGQRNDLTLLSTKTVPAGLAMNWWESRETSRDVFCFSSD